MSKEYQPHVYGGAGVHVDYLTRELARLGDRSHSLHVFFFGDRKERIENITVEGIHAGQNIFLRALRQGKLVDTLYRNVVMAGSVEKDHFFLQPAQGRRRKKEVK